ncbi:hypothetical protein V8B55DRAFT_1391565 [Mucor lusitanicus]|uniref:MARVEL domain-containing protein n=2 Tax=Mucor circinelloides f. lusitanicus TaxID=29924 RepID=A0A168QFD1_MUCCL|nr:hypothetical protein MUCCIDRAFT_106140 [Mucor lusitanicus CBS 277.49]
MIEMALLFVIQWLSITIIILNALALNAAKNSNQGLIIAAESGPQEYTLLVMGAISLLASSLLLIMYLHIFPRLLGDRPLDLSKRLLAFEIVLTLVIIALWSTASGVTVSRFNEFSSCKKPNVSTLTTNISFDQYDSSKLSSKACGLANAMIVVGFVAIIVWLMALIVSIYALSELNNFAIGDLFVMQAPIHPYQDVKIQVNREDDKHNGYMGEVQSITVPTTTKNEAFVTKAEPEKVIIANQGEAKELHYTQQQQKQKQGEKGSRKSVVIADDLQHHQPQELKPVKSIKSWNFDFSFEPLQIDLMLPSTSELTGSRKKKTNSTNPYRYS